MPSEEDRAKATHNIYTKLVKFSRVDSEIRERTGKHTNKQTYSLQYFAPFLGRRGEGQSNKSNRWSSSINMRAIQLLGVVTSSCRSPQLKSTDNQKRKFLSLRFYRLRGWAGLLSGLSMLDIRHRQQTFPNSVCSYS